MSGTDSNARLFWRIIRGDDSKIYFELGVETDGTIKMKARFTPAARCCETQSASGGCRLEKSVHGLTGTFQIPVCPNALELTLGNRQETEWTVLEVLHV